MALTKVSYYNNTGVTVPPFGVVQLVSTGTTATGDVYFIANLFSGSNNYTMIDDGKGTTTSGAAQYGSCFRAGEGPVWAAWNPSSTPPGAWTQIGPVAGQTYMDLYGFGYYFTGQYDSTNKRVLVMAVASGGGGSTGPSCPCCDWTNCITAGQATVSSGTCSYCPSGGAGSYTNTNSFSYPAFPEFSSVAGGIVWTHTSACTWQSSTISVSTATGSSSSLVTGVYQWTLTFSATPQLKLAFVSGTDVCGIGT